MGWIVGGGVEGGERWDDTQRGAPPSHRRREEEWGEDLPEGYWEETGD